MDESALLAHAGLRDPFGVRIQPQCHHRKSPVSNPIAISAHGDAKCRCVRVIMLVGSRVGLGEGLGGAGSVGVRPSSGLGANLLRGPRSLDFLCLLALVCFASTCAGPPSTWSYLVVILGVILVAAAAVVAFASGPMTNSRLFTPGILGGASPW